MIRKMEHVDATETHTLPQERRPQGLPSARIRLAPVESSIGRRWVNACEMTIATAGFAGPLSWCPDEPALCTHATRDEAMAYCIERIRKSLRGETTPEARRILKWLDGLASVDLFVEPVKLANGVHSQALVPGVAPVDPMARDMARLLARRDARRRADPLPAGGLFDDSARHQLSLF